jgi:hypothetical protein
LTLLRSLCAAIEPKDLVTPVNPRGLVLMCARAQRAFNAQVYVWSGRATDKLKRFVVWIIAMIDAVDSNSWPNSWVLGICSCWNIVVISHFLDHFELSISLVLCLLSISTAPSRWPKGWS